MLTENDCRRQDVLSVNRLRAASHIEKSPFFLLRVGVEKMGVLPSQQVFSI